MSYRDKDYLSESNFKVKLAKMGYSLDRADHPKNYYKNMYYEKSNAKNKITRDNTPFYQEDFDQIINKKRQRSSSKKTKQKNNLDFDEIDEEENVEGKNLFNNKKGIKYTRLIESKKKIKPGNNIETTEEKKKLKNEKNKYVPHEYNLRSKPRNKNLDEIKDISQEKNIVQFGAQNNNYNNNIDYNLLNVKNQPKKNKYNYIIKSSDKKNKQEKKEINTDINDINNQPIKPEIINKKKVLLKRQENNDITEQFNNKVEDKNLLFYSNNDNNDNRNINMEAEDNNNNNRTIEENPKENSETSSYFSATSSRFSRFSNYTYMSFSRLGSNIVSLKNSIMNKFRRNAYLFPLIVLILFGIVFFLNEKYESYERNNIIIIFSIIMGLIILFYLILYIKELRKYKKIAKEDRKKLLELFEQLNIRKEDIGNNTILLNNFINERIEQNNEINEETYMRYVFPYLVKYLKKDGFYLDKVENEENNSYWKEL